MDILFLVTPQLAIALFTKKGITQIPPPLFSTAFEGFSLKK